MEVSLIIISTLFDLLLFSLLTGLDIIIRRIDYVISALAGAVVLPALYCLAVPDYSMNMVTALSLAGMFIGMGVYRAVSAGR